MSNENKAVFLSYASQDADAAKRICEAMRQAGIEVWFDQSELRGGDAWDAKIRKQIKECALFVPVISANTNARSEGYFRLEWKLAVDRSHLMADDEPFLFPIVIGDVSDAAARVPDKFRDVQWTRLRLDETPGELAARVARLLKGSQVEDGGRKTEDRGGRSKSRAQPGWLRFAWAGVGIVFALVYGLRPFWKSEPKHPPPAAKVAAPAPAVSEARQLAERAREMSIRAYNSTASDFATAEGLLQKALELDPNDAEIWAISSLFHTSIRTRGFDHSPGRRQQARAAAEHAIKLAPDSVNALYALGRTQRDSDHAAAEATFRRILELEPNSADAMSQLAWIYDTEGRPDEAAALYDRVLVLDPKNAPLTHYLRYLMYFHYGRLPEADAAIKQSVALAPSANSITGEAMVALTWHGDAEAAAKALASAPAQMQSEPRLIWVGALVHLARRDPAETLRTLQRTEADYIQDNWFSGPKAMFAGLAHRMAGRQEAARVAWETALALVDTRMKSAPDNPDLHLARGQLLAWLGRPDEARREARTLAEIQTQRENFWMNSPVIIYAALGEADAALPLLEPFLKWDRNTISGWPLTPALLRIDPRWDQVRADPRFQKLCADRETAAKPTLAAPIDEKSVAVLAFANLSDDKGNEYFSDGISEELLNVLAKVPGLKVTARTSSFHFKGKDTPIPEIAQQLGVAYVVEGSVRKAGDKVRITAQLIKAADGFHVWSDTFTRDLKDIFAVQDEIAGLIAQNLQLRIGGAAARGEVNPEAHRLVLEGRHFWNLRTTDGFDRAEAAFRRAIALDPNYASAYAGLANVLGTRLGYRAYEGETNLSYEATRAAALRAIELDPADAQGYPALGLALTNEGRYAEAREVYQKALALNPNYALPHHWLSLVLELEGRVDEELVEINRAVELDPLSGIAVGTQARMLQEAGRYAEAFATYERAAAILPDRPTLSASRAMCLFKMNRRDEAVEWARKAAVSTSRELRLVADADAIHVLWQTGHEAEATAHAERALSLLGRQSYQSGAVLAAMGRLDEALPSLERTPTNMTYTFYWNPIWDAWREDPRFSRLVKKLNCEAEYKVAREKLARMQRERSATK